MNRENYIKEFFIDIIGQDSAIAFLISALNKEHLATGYLFSGPEGVGKRLTANRFIESLISLHSQGKFIRKRIENHNHPDLLWIEPTYTHQGNLITKSNAKKEKHSFRTLPQIRLEQIKDVKRFLFRQAVESGFNIIVIENIESINESASNALLKTLEEPNNGIFILTTERPESILSTILSRCQLINFNRLCSEDLRKVFNANLIHKKKELETGFEQKELLSLSNGSPGAIIKNIEFWNEIPKDLWPKVKDLDSNDPIDALSTAKDINDSLDSEQQIWLISWLQQYVWLKSTNIKAIKILEKLKSQIKGFVNPKLAWEIALLQIKNNHN
tara:strand:+ start:12035 stop:13021 length:987 start_codon:yes stop_codon:yes gene_type:complete